MGSRAIVSFVFVHCLSLPLVAETKPLAFLEPFLGSWGMPRGSDSLDDGSVGDSAGNAPDVAFRFEWGDSGQKILRFYEGIPGGDLERRVLENLVVADPRTGTVHALGYQLRNDYLYQSTFRRLEPEEWTALVPEEARDLAGYVREYRVTYPAEQEFRREEDRARGWIDYRDLCRLVATDRLHCFTEQRKSESWEAWGGADGYTLERLP